MAAGKKSQADAAGEPKFEQALARLEEIVDALAAGDLPLEKSLAAYKEGIGLVKVCQKQLKDVEQEILRLAPGPDGEPQTSPFDDDSEGEG